MSISKLLYPQWTNPPFGISFLNLDPLFHLSQRGLPLDMFLRVYARHDSPLVNCVTILLGVQAVPLPSHHRRGSGRSSRLQRNAVCISISWIRRFDPNLHLLFDPGHVLRHFYQLWLMKSFCMRGTFAASKDVVGLGHCLLLCFGSFSVKAKQVLVSVSSQQV